MGKRAHAPRPRPAPEEATPPSPPLPEHPTLADALIATARQELALRGARALSFRRQAAAAGVTLATLSYHLGSKAQILRTLVESERRADRLRHQVWLQRLAGLARFDPAAMAATIELYLDHAAADERSGGARLTSLIWADLVLRAGVDADIAPLLQPWLEERRAFWAQLFEGRIDAARTWADVVMAYVTDEGVHSLAIGDRADYRMLRRMAIERLSQRLDPDARCGLADADTFQALVRHLDPALGLAGADAGSALLLPGRRRDIAAAACAVILDEGAEALTHRAVGERIAMPASSVAYHFRSGHDLLWAGQQMVYLVAQGRFPAPGEDSIQRRYLATMRGTLSISLAAARDPSLAPQAIDLRRLRGENLFGVLHAQGHARLDGLDAQTAALMGLGATALAAAHAAAGIVPEALLDWLTERSKN